MPKVIWFGFREDSVRNPEAVRKYFQEKFILICGEVFVNKTEEVKEYVSP